MKYSSNKNLPGVLITGALSFVFVSSSLYAQESCDVSLEAALTIDSDSIVFLNSDTDLAKEQRTLYEINKQKQLVVAGDVMELSSEQQALVKEYDAKIRQLVPQVKSIAIEGVDLALKGVNLAFDGLLGEGNKVGADLSTELMTIRDEVIANVSIDKGFTVGADGLEQEEVLGNDFEQRIESAVESAVLNSMGSILVAMGQQMMSSDNDGQSFEARMENFGQTIEAEMELRTAQIEAKSQELCLAVAHVDMLEERLKSSISALEGDNVFSIKYMRNDNNRHENSDKALM